MLVHLGFLIEDTTNESTMYFDAAEFISDTIKPFAKGSQTVSIANPSPFL